MKKKNKNLLRKIKDEKLLVKQEQINREKQKSTYLKKIIKNNKELLNKEKVGKLQMSMLNHLAFSKDEDLMKKTMRPVRRRQTVMMQTFMGRSPTLLRQDSKGSFKEGVNKKKQQLDRLLQKTETATKNLHFEEKKNEELQKRLKE